MRPAQPRPDAPTISRGARNAYADLLRAGAIVSVVIGHWLATGVIRRDGRFVGVDALGVVHWGSWVTLVMQVVPVFFLVGGFANGASWNRHQAQGEPWSRWVQVRALRLLTPAVAYSVFVTLFVLAAVWAGANSLELAQAGWGVALHLWFLAAYLVVLLSTPVLHAAHRQWGLRVPAAMGLLAALIDVGVVNYHWHLIGWANYLLVWGTFHQLGFAWQDGTLTRHRSQLLALGSVVALIGLIGPGPYPVSMVGVPGARIQNASPPSAALLAFGLAQCALAVAAQAPVTRWLDRHRAAQATISTAGKMTMPIYLWHMVPVIIVIEAGYPDLVGLPPVNSRDWWQQRAAWLIALALTLAMLLAVLSLAIRTSHRLWPRSTTPRDDAEPGRPGVPLLITGIVVAAAGIGVLAVNGYAPHGQLNVVALFALVAGLFATMYSTAKARP
jgi:surface polysaccharide O-acyltransferase-like enzyme